MTREVVVRTIGDVLVPFVLIFGLYVVFHGEGGPGGGFQGGVILGSAFIIHGLVHGLSELRRLVSRQTTHLLAALGVLIYAGVGLAALLGGGPFMNHGRLRPGSPVAGHALGMSLVEIGVGLAVASVMLLIFEAFSEEPRS